MRKFLFYILLLSVVFAACSREDFVGEMETEEIIPPSEELIVGDINGIIKGQNGELLESALVQLYNETELIDETTTDASGAFKFIDVFEDDNYKLFVKKEAFSVAVSVVNDNHFDNQEIEIDLFEELFTSPFGSPVSPLDPNYVILYGEFEDSQGNAVNAEMALISNHIFFSLSTIRNGQYSTFIPKNESVELFINQMGQCQLFPEPILIQPLTSNTQQDFKSVVDNSEQNYRGSIIDCDSSLINGYMEILVNDEFQYQDIVDGQFEFEVSNCNTEFIWYSIFDDFDDQLHYGYFEPNLTFHEIQIECNPTVELGTEVEIEFNEETVEVTALALQFGLSNEIQVILQSNDLSIIFSFLTENNNTTLVNNLEVYYESEHYYPIEPLFISYELEEDPVVEHLSLLNVSLNDVVFNWLGESVSFSIEAQMPVLII